MQRGGFREKGKRKKSTKYLGLATSDVSAHWLAEINSQTCGPVVLENSYICLKLSLFTLSFISNIFLKTLSENRIHVSLEEEDGLTHDVRGALI